MENTQEEGYVDLTEDNRPAQELLDDPYGFCSFEDPFGNIDIGL